MMAETVFFGQNTLFQLIKFILTEYLVSAKIQVFFKQRYFGFGV